MSEQGMDIVLIHGQSRSPLAMALLAWRLRRHRTHLFGYLCACQSLARIEQRFKQFLRRKVSGRPYIIVAHSLGGLIARRCLPQLPGLQPQHLIMLAPPNRPARLARAAWRFPAYRLLTGDCGRNLADATYYHTLPPPTVPTTVIAGTRGLPAVFSPFGAAPNDTVLAVEETRLTPQNEVLLVPATHALIMNAKAVAAIVLQIASAAEGQTET